MGIGLLYWTLKNIRQGHCLTCGCEIWNVFDVKKCHSCRLKEAEDDDTGE